MSNVYTADYDGLGFLKIDPAVITNFQAVCAGCILNFGLYENERLRGSKTTVSDLNAFSFPIASLQPDKVYEIRLWVEQAGERKEAYAGHYFKTDQYFTSFESKIDVINTNNEVSFSSDLNFKIQGKTTNSSDSFFSSRRVRLN